MQINTKITGIQYKIFLTNELNKIQSKDFDINTCPTSCIFIDKTQVLLFQNGFRPKEQGHPLMKACIILWQMARK